MPLPRTSYGYQPPRDAQARGWRCWECGRCEDKIPRSWNARCDECGRKVDPDLREPWAHEAEGHRIRHELTKPDAWSRSYYGMRLYEWSYKDALMRQDRDVAEAAWADFDRHHREQHARGSSGSALTMVRLAVEHGDAERGVAAILSLYPPDTGRIKDDSPEYETARDYVLMCAAFLDHDVSLGHPRAAEVDAAMDEVARRADHVLSDPVKDRAHAAREKHALHRSGIAMLQARRSATTIHDDLPPFPAPAMDSDALPSHAVEEVSTALEAARTHGDTEPLDRLLLRLGPSGGPPGLTHFLRARRRIADDDLAGAWTEISAALATGDDMLAPSLAPHIHATAGLLQAHRGSLGAGIESCRTGRESALRHGARGGVTAVDAPLIRLLVWQAGLPGVSPARAAKDARAAVEVASRRCRRRNHPDLEDRILLQEAESARDALAGRRDSRREHAAWSRLVATPADAPVRARAALAWAEWAVGLGIAGMAAEAYSALVGLVAQDSAARRPGSAKQRVLAAAQEYAEEAGYWLAKAG